MSTASPKPRFVIVAALALTLPLLVAPAFAAKNTHGYSNGLREHRQEARSVLQRHSTIGWSRRKLALNPTPVLLQVTRRRRTPTPNGRMASTRVAAGRPSQRAANRLHYFSSCLGRSAKKFSHVRWPTARSGARFAPARMARAALPGIHNGRIGRCLPRARRYPRMRSAID